MRLSSSYSPNSLIVSCLVVLGDSFANLELVLEVCWLSLWKEEDTTEDSLENGVAHPFQTLRASALRTP